MRAVLCRDLGPPALLRVEDVPAPSLTADGVRIAVHAAGVNFPDLLMVRGEYQFKPPLPFVPGVEAAGVVLETGAQVRGWGPGDRVIVGLRFGAFAEQAVAPADALMALPQDWDFVAGAAYRVAFATARHALVDRGRLRRGEVALVHGAGGGVGLAAVALARRLGATVIATAGSDAKAAAARRAGACHVIDPRRTQFAERVLGLTDGTGADVVYDPVGGAVTLESLECLAWGGRLLIVGFAGGAIAQIPVDLVARRGGAVIGLRAGEYARRDPEAGRRGSRELADLMAHVRPHVSQVLPLDGAAQALQALAERRAVGKLVLKVR